MLSYDTGSNENKQIEANVTHKSCKIIISADKTTMVVMKITQPVTVQIDTLLSNKEQKFFFSHGHVHLHKVFVTLQTACVKGIPIFPLSSYLSHALSFSLSQK